MNNIFVHLFHIIFVGGLFLYIGIKQKNMPAYMYNVILTIGIIILFYHGYKGYSKFVNGKNPWVNLFHIFIVAPLLIRIGYKKDNTHMQYFEYVLMLAFAAVGYHTYYMIV